MKKWKVETSIFLKNIFLIHVLINLKIKKKFLIINNLFYQKNHSWNYFTNTMQLNNFYYNANLYFLVLIQINSSFNHFVNN